MQIVDNVRTLVSRKAANNRTDDIQTAPAPAGAVASGNDKELGMTAVVDDDTLKPDEDLVPDQGAQQGVRKMQAVTLAWTKASLAALLILFVHPQLTTLITENPLPPSKQQ